MSELPQEAVSAPQPRLPELELSVAVQILKDRYSIVCDSVEGRPYYVRFKSLSDEARGVQGRTHHDGTTISPIFLKQILERFDIPAADFLEGLASTKKAAARGLAVVPKKSGEQSQ